MIRRSGDPDVARLLRNLACEFGELADTADEIQNATAAIAHANGTQDVEYLIVQLQGMDALSQVLRDLQRLAGAVAASPLGRLPADAAFVRNSLQLQSLAKRLVSGPAADEGHGPASLLL